MFQFQFVKEKTKNNYDESDLIDLDTSGVIVLHVSRGVQTRLVS